MPVSILTSSRFRKLLLKLSSRQRGEVDLAIDALKGAFGTPHAHLGLGIRKLVGSLFELRIGLDLRILFWFEQGQVVLHFLGTHDDVRAFLKSRGRKLP